MHNQDGILEFEQQEYDLDGLIRLVDAEEAIIVSMYYEPDEDRYYRNRYDVLECERGISYILQKVARYLEEDEEQSIFIAFAATYEGRLTLLNGARYDADECNIGELELGVNLVYGMLVSQVDERYLFREVLYHDGEDVSQSWAEVIEDAGILSVEMKKLIYQFA